MKPVRILIVNDQPAVSEGVRTRLAAQPDFSIVGQVTDVPEALREARRLQPDVVLMDLAVPEAKTLAAAEQLKRDCPATQVVILSPLASEDHIFRALSAGALGYVIKEAAGQETIEAIRAARAGRRYLSPRVADVVVSNFVRLKRAAPVADPLESLSERERDVLHLVVGGRSSKEIGGLLHLAPSTVDTYRSRIMYKLGVPNVAALVTFTLKNVPAVESPV